MKIPVTTVAITVAITIAVALGVARNYASPLNSALSEAEDVVASFGPLEVSDPDPTQEEREREILVRRAELLAQVDENTADEIAEVLRRRDREVEFIRTYIP